MTTIEWWTYKIPVHLFTCKILTYTFTSSPQECFELCRVTTSEGVWFAAMWKLKWPEAYSSQIDAGGHLRMQLAAVSDRDQDHTYHPLHTQRWRSFLAPHAKDIWSILHAGKLIQIHIWLVLIDAEHRTKLLALANYLQLCAWYPSWHVDVFTIPISPTNSLLQGQWKNLQKGCIQLPRHIIRTLKLKKWISPRDASKGTISPPSLQ